MTQTPPPDTPKWLHPLKAPDSASVPGKVKYTYTMDTGKGRTKERHTITIEFLEEASLQGPDLATRRLGHLILLKTLHDATKEMDDKLMGKLLQKGRTVELITDQSTPQTSQKVAIAFGKEGEESLYIPKLNPVSRLIKEKTGGIETPLPPAREAALKEAITTDLKRKPKKHKNVQNVIGRLTKVADAIFNPPP